MQPLTEEQIEQLKNLLAIKALCALCNSLQNALKAKKNEYCDCVTIELLKNILSRINEAKIQKIKNQKTKFNKMINNVMGGCKNSVLADSLQPIYEVINTEYWKMSSKFGIPEPKK